MNYPCTHRALHHTWLGISSGAKGLAYSAPVDQASPCTEAQFFLRRAYPFEPFHAGQNFNYMSDSSLSGEIDKVLPLSGLESLPCDRWDR